MSQYFRVGTKDDSLFHYVWADNAQHAVRKVENLFGGLPPQRTVVLPITLAGIPDGDDVIDEPEDLKEARMEEE